MIQQYTAVGRRKTAVARVYLRRTGDSKIQVNRRPMDKYFPIKEHQQLLLSPFVLLKDNDQYSVVINVKGGGISGQAGAIRHGLSRALAAITEENRKLLHDYKFLTRDSRMVERKKYGRRGARRKFQFSKR